MAKQLKKFNFRGSGRTSAVPYDWDKWTNGKVWQCEKGKDFACSSRHFRTTLHGAANRKGLDVETSVSECGKFVTFRFFQPEEATS